MLFEELDLSPNAIELARREYLTSGKELIDLTSTNPTENGLIFPNQILRSAFESYLENRVYQPDAKGLLRAREAVCRYYAERSPALILEPGNIFITASTSESYSLLFSLLATEGDNFLAPSVGYPLFDLLAEHSRVSLKSYKIEEEGDWEIEEVEPTRRTRGALLISPHNPTGKIQSAKLDTLAKLNLPLIADEVFSEFTFAASTVPPLAALYPELPVFHLNGISKMFALPDLKLGWIAANDKALALYGEKLELLNDTFLSANTLVQHALPAIFEGGKTFLEEMKAEINARIQLAFDLFARSSAFSLARPEGAYFLCPKLNFHADPEDFVLKLLKQGVFVHPGYFYGMHRHPRIVISCLSDRAKLEEGVKRIIKCGEEWD